MIPFLGKPLPYKDLDLRSPNFPDRLAAPFAPLKLISAGAATIVRSSKQTYSCSLLQLT